jgi:hypothetical protein
MVADHQGGEYQAEVNGCLTLDTVELLARAE